jgi:hypothetical protein
MCVCYEGGEPQDIAPDLASYSSFDFALSRSGNRIAFLTADEDGSHVWCPGVAPRRLHSSTAYFDGVLLSCDGDIVIVASSEHSGKPQFSLLALDTVTGEKIGELWDGKENSVHMMVASPMSGDARIVATTNRTGIDTLLIWNHDRANVRISPPRTHRVWRWRLTGLRKAIASCSGR